MLGLKKTFAGLNGLLIIQLSNCVASRWPWWLNADLFPGIGVGWPGQKKTKKRLPGNLILG